MNAIADVMTMSLTDSVCIYAIDSKGKQAMVDAVHVQSSVWSISRLKLTRSQRRNGVGLHIMDRLTKKIEERNDSVCLVAKFLPHNVDDLDAFMQQCEFTKNHEGSWSKNLNCVYPDGR